MAPEIIDRKCCYSVDVYAFGVLLWYLCAGRVCLPTNFEKFSDKSDLWSNVKMGKFLRKITVIYFISKHVLLPF